MEESPEDLKRLVTEQQARSEASEASAEQPAASAAIADTLTAFVTQPGDHVTAQIGGPYNRQFVRAGLDGQPAAPTQGEVREPLQLPGEALGAALIRRATTPQPERGDPRIDPSQPLALGAHTGARK